MVLETEEFLEKFHNLGGNTIGARQKSLNLLLRNVPPDHDAVITSLTPMNHLEQLFKLELLLKLQRIPELVEILKSEDEHLIKKLLKSRWFCQRLVSLLEENCDGFVTNIFPCMSYVCKRRLLKKLAIYGNNLDTFFDEVNIHYGLHLAMDVLLGCTEAKIRNIVKEYKFEFKRFQLILLRKKYSLSQQRFIRGPDQDRKTYVDAKGSTAALEIMEKYNLYRKWGKRLTRKLLLSSKEFVIANARMFHYSLHPRTLIRTLDKEDFKLFYFKCWPVSFTNDFDGNPTKLEKQLGIKRHYLLLLEGMKLKYNKSLYDYPDLVSYEMMETMDETEREKWINIKKEEMNVFAYLKTSESIPLFKRKMKTTSSIWDRERLIRLLVESCKINQDLNALAKVAKYVSVKYRDDHKILEKFLSSLKRYFDLKKFDQHHWKLIQPLIKIISLDKNNSNMVHSFGVSYVEFLFRQDKLKDGDLLSFIKTMKSIDCWHLLDEFCDDLKKIILLKLIDIMPDLVEENDLLHCYDWRTISFIINWNKKHLEDQILFLEHPRLVDSLSQSFRDMRRDFDRCSIPLLYLTFETTLNTIIYKCENSDLRDEALKTYFSLERYLYNDLKIDLWLLKCQPEIIAANFNKFMEHVTYYRKLDHRFIYRIKKYSHLAFPEKAVEFCLNKLRQRGENESKKLLKILVILSSRENFLQYVSPYYLSEAQMDVDEAIEDIEKKKIAINVVNTLKYTRSTEVLPVIMEYSKGDLLNSSLESLHYLFCHLPENKLNIFFDNLSTQAVSVIKNTIRFTCIVGTVSVAKALVTHFIEKEHNVWLRKQLFFIAFKYFTKNPSDDLWESVKIWLTKLDNSDDERFEMTLKLLKGIPAKYQPYKTLFAWECWKKTEAYYASRSPDQLLTSISSEAIEDLPLELILELISENFLKNQYRVDKFIVSCLIKTNYKNEILKAIFDIVSKVKIQKDEECDTDNLPQEKRLLVDLSDFIKSGVKKIAIEERNEEVLHLFAQKWYELCGVDETEISEEYLQFALGRLYCQFGGEDLLRLNKAIMDFLKELTMTCGTGIVDLFAAVLKATFDFYNEPLTDYYTYSYYYYSTESANKREAYFDLCMDIIDRDELIFFILVIELLPKKLPTANDKREKFQRIIQRLKLRGTSTKSLLVYLNRYIRNLSFFERYSTSPVYYRY